MSTSTHRGNSQGANPGRFRANQPGSHTLAVRGRDSCPTPRIAVESLLAAEPDVLNTMARVWEPAAGDGNIVYVLRDNCISVVAGTIEKWIRNRRMNLCAADAKTVTFKVKDYR